MAYWIVNLDQQYLVNGGEFDNKQSKAFILVYNKNNHRQNYQNKFKKCWTQN